MQNVLRRAAFTAVLVAIAACSGGGAAASARAPAEADASIDAKDNAFSPTELALPAGEPSQLFFRNLDGVPHNVAVYTDATATTAVFVGEIITNAATTYELPAMEAGEYFFRCDVHPEMTGTAVAGG